MVVSSRGLTIMVGSFVLALIVAPGIASAQSTTTSRSGAGNVTVSQYNPYTGAYTRVSGSFAGTGFGNSNGNNGSGSGARILPSVTGSGPTNGQPVQIITSFQSGNIGSNGSYGNQNNPLNQASQVLGGGLNGNGGLGNLFGANGGSTGSSSGNGGATPPPGVLLSAQYARTFVQSIPNSGNPLGGTAFGGGVYGGGSYPGFGGGVAAPGFTTPVGFRGF